MNNEGLVKFVRLNRHLAPDLLQKILFDHGHVVPLDMIQGVLYSLDTVAKSNEITSPKGQVINNDDLDTIIQYALAAGMPRTYLKG